MSNAEEMPSVLSMLAPGVVGRLRGSARVTDLSYECLDRFGPPSAEMIRTQARRVFAACWDDGFSPSLALTAVWSSRLGRSLPGLGLTPQTLWAEIGRPSWDEWQAAVEEQAAEAASALPEWWGSAFERWAASAAPEVPGSYRRTVGWAVLSALLGVHVATPIGPAAIGAALFGTSATVREDARCLGGAIDLALDSSALSGARLAFDRLTAIEPDDVTSAEALRERQGPADHARTPELARLTAAALDGLERAQALAGGPLVVRSSDEALDAVTAFKTDLAARMRTREPSSVDAVLSGSARLVRSMAALVAVASGETLVNAEHQSIAIDAARHSIEGQIRVSETVRVVV